MKTSSGIADGRLAWRTRSIKVIAVSLVVVGIVVGVLLGVRRFHDESLRYSCEMNLKSIGLSLHNYNSVYDCLPLAALTNDRLRPDERIGWQVSVIPYMFCLHCYGLSEFGEIDQSRGWEAGPQRGLAVSPVSYLLCPDAPYVPRHGAYLGWQVSPERALLTENVPATYIGIAGVGADAPFLKKGEPGAGVFGYDRVTTFGEITDGMSSTMMVVETSSLEAPWTSGGHATVQGLDPARLPYVGRGRQFGGNHRGAVEVLFADGSVRTIRDSIAPKMFEALSTIAGGEILSQGWER